MEQLYIVNRTEGDYIVIESPNGEMIDVKKEKIKGNAKDGDCLICKNDYFFIDEEATLKKKQGIAGKMEGMWKE